MTKSEIYEYLYDYISKQEGADRLKEIISHGEIYRSPVSPILKLTNLAIKIREDLCNEAASKIGKNNVVKLMTKIIKEAYNLPRQDLHGTFEINEFQCVCDSYRFLRTKTHFDLPIAPERFTAVDYLVKTIDNASTFKNELPLPNIVDLKAIVKSQKNACSKSPKYTFDFGEEKPMVNSKYLMEILEGIPDARIFWSGNKIAPIYIRSNDSDIDMILMPIRK